jgi:hypothetical protein
MASRAELIMAQVRGGLAQEYRKKGPTKGEGIIQDLTGAALGYNTATEAMYALEGGIQKIKDRRYKKGKMNPMNNKSYVNSLQTDEIYGEPTDLEMESIVGPENQRTPFDELEPYSPPLEQPVRPGDPSPIVTTQQSRYVSPGEVPADMYGNLPSLEYIENQLSDNFLAGMQDIYYGNNGPVTTTMAQSTGVKFNNVDISSLPSQPNVNYEAAGITAWNTGRDMSDVATLRGRNNMDYLMDLDNGYPDVEPFTMSGTPYGPTQPLDNPGKPEVPLPTEEGASLLGNLSLTETSKDGTDITDMKSEGVPGLGGSYNTREYTDKKGKTMYETRFAQEYKKDGKSYYFATKPKQHGDESMSRRVNSTSLKDMELITKEEYDNFAGYSVAKPDKKKRRFKRRNK